MIGRSEEASWLAQEVVVLVTGLDHVQLVMPPGREADARHFYTDLLGLREVPKPAPLAARGGCWFQAANVGLHLSVESGFQPARKAHPALLVQDLEAARRILEAAGSPVVPDDAVPNVRRFYTADPFGNRIELIQNGDGFSQR
jgi:catechol 2,3-dioxygenase-like lactoylglutathione lyase family enzyme